MKIWQKLGLAFGGTSFLLGAVAFLAIKTENQVTSATNETVHGMVEEAKAASQIFSSVQKIQQLNQKFLLAKATNTEKDLFFEDYENDIDLELKKLEQKIIASQQASINQKLIIQSSNPPSSTQQQNKIESETEEVLGMTLLLLEIQEYQKDWQLFFKSKQASNQQFYLDFSNRFTKRMEEVIIPLVEEYYEDSLSEITSSELATQKLTSQNITIIKNFLLFTLVITLLLYIYIYRSIYIPIRYLKLATFNLGLDPSKYIKIPPQNPHDELGSLTIFFNRTVDILKEKVISKSELGNLINSINQGIIIIDNQNKINLVNQNILKILGYSQLELLERSIQTIWSATNTLTIDQVIQLDDISSRCFTIDLINKQLQLISLTVYFSLLLDAEGKRKGTICLVIPSHNLSLSDLIHLRKRTENIKSQYYKNQ